MQNSPNYTMDQPEDTGLIQHGASLAPIPQQQPLYQPAMGMAEGGMLQEGGSVDEVSGNKVPAGAMKEEVRDDIPAQLSEGEFVFPADVVRYIGLERLMMMRQAAKKGLMQMEEMGQMSNGEDGSEEEDTAEFESQIDDIMGEMEPEEDSEVEMQAGGMVREKVGKPTGEMSTAGRPLYKTAEGETVSEKSITVPFAGEWVNVPSIQDGVRYDDAEIEDMLASGKIKPTSTHKTVDEAVAAAKARSSGLIKPKMAVGGMAMPNDVTQQTQAAFSQTPATAPAAPAPTATPEPVPMEQSAPVAEAAPTDSMQAAPQMQASKIISADIQREGYTPEQQAEINMTLSKVAGAKAVVLQDKNTVLLGVAEKPGYLTMKMFSVDTPEDRRSAIATIIPLLKKANIKGIDGVTKNEELLAEFEAAGYTPKITETDAGTYSYAIDMQAK